MGLDMKTRNKVCGQIFKRYQKASKKGKSKILDEYSVTLKMNRDYLAHKLTNWEKKRYAVKGGKITKYVAKPPFKSPCKASGGKKRGRPEKYHKAFVTALTQIWEFFDMQCGKLLAPLIKSAIAFLAFEFNLTEEQQELFKTVSASAIDRKLKQEKSATALREYQQQKKELS